jgi:hypothetical protein
MYCFLLELQGLICFPLKFYMRGGAVAVGCGGDSRIRGRIGLWVFVPLVIVCSIAFLMFLLRTFKTFLHGYVA